MDKANQEKEVPSEIPLDHIKLYFIDILKDPAVISQLKAAFAVGEEAADRIAARLDARFKALQADLKKKDEEIRLLRDEVESLKEKADDNEQYSRRTSVRITGLPEAVDEDSSFPEQEVKRILTAVGSDAVIQRCHRVGPRSPPPRLLSTAFDASSSDDVAADDGVAVPPAPRSRAIICQLTGQRDKRQVMSLKKRINTQFSVHINEDLTRHRASLAYHARVLKRDKKIKNTWTSDGKILVQDTSNVIHVVRRTIDLTKWH